MSTILTELLVPLNLDSSKFDSGIDNAISKSNSLVGGLSAVGGEIIVGGMGIAAGAVTALTSATVMGVKSASDWAGTLDNVSQLLGTTGEESAGLAVLAQRLGMPVDNVTSSLAKMTNGLVDTDGKLGATGQQLQKLGIATFDANGNMRSSTAIFQDVANVIGNMPDGLEKSGLEMSLFGRTGAEMGDILSAAANGGLADFTQQAKDMGLSMDSGQVQNMIDMQKKGEQLNQTLQGMSMKLGFAVIPALSQFADIAMSTLAKPEIQLAITKLTQGVGYFASTVVSYIPVIIDGFSQFSTWLTNNQGVIVGVLAALGVAVGAFVYSTVIPAAIATITALAPIIAVMALVGLAGYALYEAWTTNFGGIQEKVQAVWAFLEPIFNTIKTWLSINIPVALKTLASYWQNVLLPAIQSVWGWMNSTLFPFLQALGSFLGTVFGLAITALAGLWQNVLWPAIKNVIEWMQKNVVPILQPIANFIGGVFKQAFDNISKSIQLVTGAIKTMTSALSKIKLPSWLTPGSPTPFEIGLVGIHNAMKSLNNSSLPEFSTNLKMNGVNSPINSYVPPTNEMAQTQNSTIDYYRLASVLAPIMRDAVMQAQGG